MNSQYISDFQLDQVRAVLKKYGIESTDLLEELTDHFAGLLEERIENGASFDEAFQKFVSENSWFKLRKLQHAHWKYSEKSLKRYVINLLRDLWLTPKIIFPIGFLFSIYGLLRLPVAEAKPIFDLLHIAFIAITLYIAARSLITLRAHKTAEVSRTASMSVSVFYAVFLSVWTSNALFYPVFSGEYAFILHLTYYLLLAQLSYIHICLYQKAVVGLSSKTANF